MRSKQSMTMKPRDLEEGGALKMIFEEKAKRRRKGQAVREQLRRKYFGLRLSLEAPR